MSVSTHKVIIYLVLWVSKYTYIHFCAAYTYFCVLQKNKCLAYTENDVSWNFKNLRCQKNGKRIIFLNFSFHILIHLIIIEFWCYVSASDLEIFRFYLTQVSVYALYKTCIGCTGFWITYTGSWIALTVFKKKIKIKIGLGMNYLPQIPWGTIHPPP